VQELVAAGCVSDLGGGAPQAPMRVERDHEREVPRAPPWSRRSLAAVVV
jgi:hypothetical protein